MESKKMVSGGGTNYGAIPASEGTPLVKIKTNTKMPSRWVILLIAGGLLTILGGVLFPVVSQIVKNQVEKKVVISNKSETYDVWQDNPVPIYMQFYMFNVENEAEILAGKTPLVSQHGPYTYREKRLKYNITWNPNGTVTYRQRKTFHFIREMSIGKESDMYKTINPLMATVAQAIQWIPGWIRKIISFVINATGADGIFMTRPIKEILWGYEDPTLTKLNKVIPLWFHSTNVGYFSTKNDTDDGLYTVYTGESDVTKVGQIDKYNGQRYIDMWSSPWANMVNGSDGTLGQPFQFNQMEQSAYISDLCRTVNGYYKDVVHSPQGIPLRRFTGNDYILANTSINPDNIGFCVPDYKCLPSGLLNATLCQPDVDYFRVPAILSFPHFLYADPEVQKSVYGLNPNLEEHETTIDVEPWTGLTLQVSSRLQINFFVEKVPEISQMGNMSKLYFPILWLNESAKTDKEHEDLLLNELFMPMTILTGVKITLLVIGVLLCVVAIVVISKRARDDTKLLKSGAMAGKGTMKAGGYDSQGHLIADTLEGTLGPQPPDQPRNRIPNPKSSSPDYIYPEVPRSN